MTMILVAAGGAPAIPPQTSLRKCVPCPFTCALPDAIEIVPFELGVFHQSTNCVDSSGPKKSALNLARSSNHGHGFALDPQRSIGPTILAIAGLETSTTSSTAAFTAPWLTEHELCCPSPCVTVSVTSRGPADTPNN